MSVRKRKPGRPKGSTKKGSVAGLDSRIVCFRLSPEAAYLFEGVARAKGISRGEMLRKYVMREIGKASLAAEGK